MPDAAPAAVRVLNGLLEVPVPPGAAALSTYQTWPVTVIETVAVLVRLSAVVA